ncbi:hypothetical protein VHA01S_031_00050 [Vibrio halioticoli NBRC 102217]|uniref:Uncharacterized protein n=1 Tax=Vibrio halioticoli NBRC 102217 TaxID=1219072 RepID=V5FMB4_9VIBR|nr:BtrH N-terminal domain-containing protein [Vibrio halioticoli]GAD89992.1 hypothetical protein VHA01S_031_00050 [Vibrio halioticoli NBRC 102217]
MSERVYDYDQSLFSRNYLNCAQRHSVVMLKRFGVSVEWLFYNSLVSTDSILEQLVIQGTPKYDFASACLADSDFIQVGVERKSHFNDSFAAIKQDLLKCIERDGFVLLAGDVYYYPHCPEYRNEHLFHLVILTGYDESRDTWQMIDDNPASVLCEYEYSSDEVAAFYENSDVREYRSYQRVSAHQQVSAEYFLNGYDRYFSACNDSYRLLTNIEEIIENPWLSKELSLHKLQNAFSVMIGSRTCFASYILQQYGQSEAYHLATSASVSAEKVRGMLLRSKITGKLNLASLNTRCMELVELEKALIQQCQALREL